jgi:5'-methylthioadenosine phosphorylase
MPAVRNCKCGSVLSNALLTAPDKIPFETRQKLDLLIGKYLGGTKI